VLRTANATNTPKFPSRCQRICMLARCALTVASNIIGTLFTLPGSPQKQRVWLMSRPMAHAVDEALLGNSRVQGSSSEEINPGWTASRRYCVHTVLLSDGALETGSRATARIATASPSGQEELRRADRTLKRNKTL
jgi:hypothetical protein